MDPHSSSRKQTVIRLSNEKKQTQSKLPVRFWVELGHMGVNQSQGWEEKWGWATVGGGLVLLYLQVPRQNSEESEHSKSNSKVLNLNSETLKSQRALEF